MAHPIEIVRGDLLESKAQVLAHGCNTFGVMGAGIARVLTTLYPRMYDAYSTHVLARRPHLLHGTAFLWNDPRGSRKVPVSVVACLFTQLEWNVHPPFVERAFEDLGAQMHNRGLTTLAFPAIGCGIAAIEGFGDAELRACVEKGLSGYPRIRPTLYLLP